MSNVRSLARLGALACGFAMLVVPGARAQDSLNKYGNPMKHTPKPTTPAITPEELRTRLYIFSDDSMQGRKVGTVGNMKGTNYIAAELKRLGVQPGGEHGTYFQNLPYVQHKFSDRSTLSVNGAPLALNVDFVPVPGARAPKPIENVQVIYGGVEGDTANQITPGQAAGKFVVLSAATGTGSARGGRGGRGGGGGRGAAPAAAELGPDGCPVAAGGRGGARGGGGRGGAIGGGGSDAARFADAIAIATINLDELSMAARAELNDPAATQAGGRGGRGGGGGAGASADMVVNMHGQIAIVRGGSVVSGTLPAGWTPSMVQQKADSMVKKSADSAAWAAERSDSMRAAAKRLLAAGGHAGKLVFRGTTIALDSGQVRTLACMQAPAGRGAAAGGAAGRGRGAGGNGAPAAAAPEPLVGSFRITAAAATKLFGRSVAGLAPGTGGSSVTADLDYQENPTDWGRNVIGIIRGSDPRLAGEYVAIGAHNDHNGFSNNPLDHDSLKAYYDAQLRLEMSVVKGDLRAAPPAMLAAIHVNMDSIRKIHPVPRLDSIQNGADDDGSGSMGVLEIAEAVQAMPVKPKRSIIFVWHTGEEAGTLGSLYFVAHPTVPLDSIVAQINIDMIGRGRAEDMVGGGPNYLGAVGSRRLSTELNHEMLAVNAAEPGDRRLRIDYRFDDPTLGVATDGKPVSWPGYNSIYTRSDHYSYAAKCIPIVFFFTGLHGDYHKVTDEPQYIDYPHFSMITNYIRDLLVDVANRPVRPSLDNVCTRR